MTLSSINLPPEIYARLTELAQLHDASIEDTLAKLITEAHDRLEETKKISPTRFMIAEKVLDMMAEGVMVRDQKGKIIFANESAERILGATPEELLKYSEDLSQASWRTIREDGSHSPPEDAPAYITLRTGKPLRNQVFAIQRRDGDLVWISINTQLVQINDTESIVIASFSDITPQKLVEAELRQEEARKRAILESIPGTIITVDQDFTIVDLYSQIAIEEGLDYKQFIGKSLSALMTEPLVQAGISAIDEVFETGQQTLYRIQSDTGRWYDNRVNPVMQDGEITAVTITSIEITEQVKAEQALRESEGYVRAVLKSTPGSIITINPDLTVRSLYSAPAQSQGLDVEEYVGESLLNIVPEASVEDTRKHILEVFETGKPTAYEALALSGVWYTIHVAPTRFDDEGRVLVATMISLDISAIKEAEEALKRSESNLVAILQSTPGAMYSVGRDGRILQVHSWMWNTIRRHPDELQAEFIWELTPDEHGKALTKQHIEHAFNARALTSSEIRGQDMRWYDVRSAPIIRDDEVVAVIFIALDIHDRKLLEQKALDVALEKERVRVLSNFVSDASHEFRTPLAAMNTSLYLLEREKNTEKRAYRIAQIQRQIFYLTTLVNDLLTLSRLDSGVTFKTYTFKLNQLVDELLQTYHSRFAEHKIALTVDMPDENLTIVANSDELTTAFKKIIDNAVRFTPDGGKIHVRGYYETEFAVIEVIDSGKGMTEEERERALERFYRSDYSHTTRGFGLGLPIAMRIIEGHCGHLILHSEEGKGTSVIVRLPLTGCLS